MSEGKIYSQVAHAVKNLGQTPKDCSIIVLKVSDKKFFEAVDEYNCYVQVDLGLTEVLPNTPTAAAWIEVDEYTTNAGKYEACDDWIHVERLKANGDNYCPICGQPLNKLEY